MGLSVTGWSCLFIRAIKVELWSNRKSFATDIRSSLGMVRKRQGKLGQCSAVVYWIFIVLYDGNKRSSVCAYSSSE